MCRSEYDRQKNIELTDGKTFTLFPVNLKQILILVDDLRNDFYAWLEKNKFAIGLSHLVGSNSRRDPSGSRTQPRTVYFLDHIPAFICLFKHGRHGKKKRWPPGPFQVKTW
jgi:hypothetical protein